MASSMNSFGKMRAAFTPMPCSLVHFGTECYILLAALDSMLYKYYIYRWNGSDSRSRRIHYLTQLHTQATFWAKANWRPRTIGSTILSATSSRPKKSVGKINNKNVLVIEVIEWFNATFHMMMMMMVIHCRFCQNPFCTHIFRFDSNELVGSMFPIYIIAIPFWFLTFIYLHIFHWQNIYTLITNIN